jgi:hypothetical protein
MNGWAVLGFVLSFVVFVWGWALLVICVDDDALEIERYEQMKAWFEDVFE